MFSRFFIDRPIFASVVSLLILITGIVAYLKLPVAQFPDIVPPSVTVTATYSGADPKTLTETVAIPIEQQVNGVDNMIYMSSTSSSNGTYSLTVYFEVGTDPDMSTVLVQNRVSLAEPILPEDVKRLGVTVKKRSSNMLGIYSLLSNDSAKDELYLSNFMSIFIKDQIARVNGVGEAFLFDTKDYSMRIWLNPEILAERNISVQEVASVIKEQNVQVAAGNMGSQPVPKGQNFALTIMTQGRLSTPEQFEELVVRTDDQGRVLKLKDIARIELGRSSYGVASTCNGQPSSSMAIYLAPGANAIDVRDRVEAKMKELQPIIKENDLTMNFSYDQTNFIKVSIDEVKETLYIAIIIVIAVVYFFLQDWRAALIPTMTIPVSLVGCFFLMMLFNFSLNTLTMFGLVLVIGIVVDDAILVVENTQRILDEEDLSPNEAAKKSMDQVSGPIVGTTCVLCSVFVPTTFIGGMVGQLYTQFALTIASSVVISALCALTISPALCALFLRKKTSAPRFFGFRLFNWCFNGFAKFYSGNLHSFLRLPALILIFWFALCGALYWGMNVMPSGFIPNEDQGVLFLDVRLPDGASFERTLAAREKVQQILENAPGKEGTVTIAGYSMLDGSSSENVMFAMLILKDWEERTKAEGAFVLQQKLMAELNLSIPEARIFVFSPPPIMGIGTSSGLECQLMDTRGAGNTALFETAQTLMEKGMESGVFANTTCTFQPTVPQIYLDIDREKAKKMGVALNEVFATLQSYAGIYYVNDFNQFERIFRVYLQADGQFRKDVKQILNLPVMNDQGKKLPLRSITSVREITAPQYLSRFNLNQTSAVTMILANGKSTGDGIARIEEIAQTLPEGFSVGWSGMTFQEKQTGNTVYVVFVLALIFGFLSLAALYESWSAPVIIMMAVPLGVSGAILAVALRGMDINIYTQIGLILMVGLSAKNAILITEVARDIHLKERKSAFDSAFDAGTRRLRPIMMTSFAFILGVVPLAIASGAGSNSRQAIGTAVCGGMLEETLIGILVTPVLFVMLTTFAEKGMKLFHRMLGSK